MKKRCDGDIRSEASQNLAVGTTMLAEKIALRYCRYRIKGCVKTPKIIS